MPLDQKCMNETYTDARTHVVLHCRGELSKKHKRCDTYTVHIRLSTMVKGISSLRFWIHENIIKTLKRGKWSCVFGVCTLT